MGFIAWIVLGLISGFIASKIVNKTGEGLVLDIILRVDGAPSSRRVLSSPHFFGATGVTGLNIYSLFVAVVGAVIVLGALSSRLPPPAEI